MSAWSSRPPEQLAAWQRLAGLAARQAEADLPPLDADRLARFSGRIGPLLVNFARQRLDDDARRALLALATESGLAAAIRDVLAGHRVNVTESRSALHTALRMADDASEGGTAAGQAATEARRVRERFLDFAEEVRTGGCVGVAGRPIEAILHIGIGGSHLGPALAVDALGGDGPEVRFLANVDGAAMAAALAGLNPATTLAIVASKSFATEETLANAAAVRSWFIERTSDPGIVARHFAAVTANADAAVAFGIPPARCWPLWDWVGGRFSIWSAAGLPVAIACGRAAFVSFLEGAREVDAHFRDSCLRDNLPAMLALLEVWNGNFLGAATHAVLPYDHRLRLLPEYLQQLEMESNGKSMRLDGQPSGIDTVPVVWGGEETNGQHAYHQLLHQGTRPVSVDLIACARAGHGPRAHQDALLANCFAQGQALWQGRAGGDPHRRIDGGRPSTTILLDELSPRALGALLALYEHKVFCAGAIWQVNSFDQWGVEAGKQLAAPIRSALGGVGDEPGDSLTNGLVAEARRLRVAGPHDL